MLCRRYFGGKDCLAYAADAIDANIRNVQSDVESGGEFFLIFFNQRRQRFFFFIEDVDCDSIAAEDFVDHVKSMHADSDSGFARLYEVIL